MTMEAVIQYESWDPVLGHQLPVEDAGRLKLLRALERGDSSSYSLCGAPGDSLYPHPVCLHARVCVRGALEKNTKGENVKRPSGQ